MKETENNQSLFREEKLIDLSTVGLSVQALIFSL
jgi:hypothetical protein